MFLSWFRHPSYAGFFYWALGTQLVLQNPISFVLYLVILWRFFYRRIQGKCSLLCRLRTSNSFTLQRRKPT